MINSFALLQVWREDVIEIYKAINDYKIALWTIIK